MATITVFTSQKPDWSTKFLKALANRGYTINIASDQSLNGSVSFHDMAHSPTDVILTMTLADALKVERTLATLEDSMETVPLLVLVTESLPEEVPIAAIDLILPPQAAYLDVQLRNMLKSRRTQHDQTEALEAQTHQLQDDLERQKRLSGAIEVLKNAIVRNVSHELKTPLLQVKSAVALLAEDVANQELIDYAKNATARLETLVKNITMLGSSLDMNPSPVIVRDAIEYARRNLARIWEHRDAGDRIVVELEPNLPPVEADKQGLSTALQLLIDNALKFSQENVIVSAKREGDFVLISVTDFGIGIAKSELKAIFETFYQIDSSSTRRYGGTGVGLAIVKLILENHGTDINVKSLEGKGSTFSFSLPIVNM